MQKTNVALLLIVLLLVGCKPNYTPGQFEALRYDVISSDSLFPDTAVQTFIASYRIQLAEEMGQVIGHSAQLMYRGKPESPLTNFVADLLLKNSNQYSSALNKEINPDISLVNVYGFRNSIPEGSVTLGAIYEVMPFDNLIVYSYLRGDKFRNLCEKIAAHGGEGVSGMQMVISNKKPKSVMVRGDIINDTSIYCIITSDYLAGGGGGFSELKKAERTIRTNVLLRDAIIKEVVSLRAENKSITATQDGRIYVE